MIKICVRTCNMNSTLGSVVPLAMFYKESSQAEFVENRDFVMILFRGEGEGAIKPQKA